MAKLPDGLRVFIDPRLYSDVNVHYLNPDQPPPVAKGAAAAPDVAGIIVYRGMPKPSRELKLTHVWCYVNIDDEWYVVKHGYIIPQHELISPRCRCRLIRIRDLDLPGAEAWREED